MNQHFQRRARPAYGNNNAQRQQRRDQRPADEQQDDKAGMTLDQYAGAVARELIKEAGLEDSTPVWRAIKRAYLTGYDEASR